jgi:hypothetical protein
LSGSGPETGDAADAVVAGAVAAVGLALEGSGKVDGRRNGAGGRIHREAGVGGERLDAHGKG